MRTWKHPGGFGFAGLSPERVGSCRRGRMGRLMDRVIGLSPLQIQRRFTAAARAAGIEAHLTAHSGRVGLASELTARGASTTEVMLAGNWRTSRMVAHYSAGATAERGAVAKYL